jgi:hypothetical protein
VIADRTPCREADQENNGLLHVIAESVAYAIEREENILDSQAPELNEKLIYERICKARNSAELVRERLNQVLEHYATRAQHRELVGRLQAYVDQDLDPNVTTLVQARDHLLAWLDDSIAFEEEARQRE